MIVTKLLAAATLAIALATPAMAKTPVINVQLWDKDGAYINMSKDMGLGFGMNGDMSKAVMGITIDKESVKAGKVAFEV